MKRIHLGITTGKSYYFFRDYDIFPSKTTNNLKSCFFIGPQSYTDYKKVRAQISVSNNLKLFSNQKMRYIKIF